MESGGESRHCRRFCLAELVQRFPETLPLFNNINDEAASSDSARAKIAVGSTHLDSLVLFNTVEHVVLLYIESAAAHTGGQKQILSSMVMTSIPMPR